MTFSLSRPARMFLIQGFFAAAAIGSLYGIWDNREFLTRYPFYFTAAADLAFAAILGYFAIRLAHEFPKRRLLITRTVMAFWLYTVGMGVGATGMFVSELGLARAVEATGFTSPALYFAYEALYVLVVPSIAFAVVLWILKRLGPAPTTR